MRHWLPAALAALLVTLGCSRPPTQLVVVVDTDLVAGADYTCFGLLVSRLDGTLVEPGATRRFLMVPADATAPFSFGVAPPDGDFRRRVEVAVEALARCDDPGPTDRIVRRAVRTGFLRDQSLRLPLYLPASCGDGCVERESCPASGPECEPPPVIEPEQLAPTVPTEELDGGFELPEPADAFVGVDANVPDANLPDAFGLDAPGLDANVPDANPPDAFVSVDAAVGDAALLVDAQPISDGGVSMGCTTMMGAAFTALRAGTNVLVPRRSPSGWRLFQTATGDTSWQDDAGGTRTLVTRSASSVRVLPLTAQSAPGDVITLFGTVEGESTVSRWAAPYTSPTMVIATGALHGSGASALLPSGDVVLVVDEGVGRRGVLWRVSSGGAAVPLEPIATDAGSIALAPAPTGALAAVGGSGACRVIGLASDGSPTTPIVVPVVGSCAQVAIAAVGATGAVLAHVSGPSGSESAAYQVLDLSARTVGPPIGLGPAVPSHIEVLADGVTGGVRVIWQDATALSSLAVSAAGAPGSRHCLRDGGTTVDYSIFRAAQRDGTTIVLFGGGTRGGTVFVELSGP